MAGLKFDITGDNSNMLSALQGVQNGVKETRRVVEESGSSIENIFGNMKSAIATAIGAFSAQQLASRIITVRGEFQQLETAFITMLGGSERAKSLMDQLTKTAATTPFDLKGVATGAKQLLAYGIEADKVNETIIRLGDIASGLSIPLGDLVYLYGTTMTQGRMFTQDLRQFQGRGIPIADELAKQFGVAKESVGDLVSAGKVGAEEFSKAIVAMTSEGGRFANNMKNQSETILGQISNIEDAIDSMFNEIGQQNEGLINAGLSGVSALVDNWKPIGKIVLEVAVAYGIYKAALLAVYAAHKAQVLFETISAFLSLAKSVHTAKDAMLLFNFASSANPIGLVVSAIAAAAAAFYLFSENTSSAAKAQDALNKIKEDAAAKMSEEKNKIELLNSVAEDEINSMRERLKACERLNEIVPGYNAHIDATTKKYKANKDALDAYLESLKKKYELEGAKEQLREIGKKKAELNVKKSPLEEKLEGARDFAKNVSRQGVGSFKFAPSQAETSFHSVNTSSKKDELKRINKELADLEAKEKAISKIYDPDLKKDALSSGAKKTGPSESIKEQKKALQEKLDALRYEEAVGKKGAELRKQIRALEEKEKVYSSSYGTKKTGEGKGGKKHNLEEEKLDREKRINDYKKSVLEQEEEAELSIRQQSINLKEESYEKERLQIALNYDRLIAENKKRRKSMLEALEENKVTEWQNKHPKATKVESENYRKTLNLTDKDLSPDQQKSLNNYDLIAKETKLKEEKELYKKLLEEFQDYEQKRTKINEDFDKKRKEIENSPIDSSERSRAIEVLEQERKKTIKKINDEEVSSMKGTSSLFIELFEDVGEKSTKEIDKIIEKTEELLSYLKSTSSEDLVPRFGFTSEQLKTLKDSPEKIKDITKQLKSLKDTARTSNPFKQLAKDIKILFAKNEKEKGVETKIKNIGKSASEVASIVGDATGNLAKMFEASGDNDLAEDLEDIREVMKSVGNIAQGFATGGVAGGVMAIFGEVTSWLTRAFQVEAEHAKELQKIQDEKIAQQRSYNLALHEQNIEYERANTIFGKLDYKKVVNSVSAMRKAYTDLNNELRGDAGKQFDRYNYWYSSHYYSKREAFNSDIEKTFAGLSTILIKTGHKKGSLISKGYDLHSGLLAVYPQLIDASGKFNKTLAESIVNNRTFANGGKERLQYMIDLYKKAEEAFKPIKEYFSSIFGDFGNSMTDALITAFKNGEDAGKAFGDSVSKMLENIGKNIIFQNLFSGIIEDANDKMLEVVKRIDLSEDSKFKSYVEILDNMTTQILNKKDVFDELMNRYQNIASEKGISLFKKDNEEQKASANGISSISYEQANDLHALTTAANISRDQIKTLVTSLMEKVFSTSDLSSSTNILVLEIRNLMIYNNNYLEDILKYTKSIYNDFAQRIDDVNKNLKEIR